MQTEKKERSCLEEAEDSKVAIDDRNDGNGRNVEGTSTLPDSEYIRVGTQYFRNTRVPQWRGKDLCLVRRLIPWTKEAIKEDAKERNYLVEIPRFKGFITYPSHTAYKEVVFGQFVNQYNPIPAHPMEGRCDKTIEFLSHIFGKQLCLGLDYLQLLYLHPLQMLPILLLVSNERATGKTTFLRFLRLLFGENVTINRNDEFQDRFNSSWTNKLLICVDEVLLKTEKAAQNIKYLSTADSFKTESKGVDKQEGHFFGKFVMTSNNENNPVYIEPGEIRYWVIKVSPLKSHDDKLLDALEKEVPAFLYFLQHRKMATQEVNRSRMWFWPKEIETEALKKIEALHVSPLVRTIKDILQEIMEREGVDKVQFSLGDMCRFIQDYGGKTDKGQIRDVLNRLGFLVGGNNYYTAYLYYDNQTGRYFTERRKDRHYTISRVDIDQKF